MTMGRKVITNRGKSHQNKAVIEILLLFGVQRYEFISNLQTFTHLFSKNILFSQSQLGPDTAHQNMKANYHTFITKRNINASKKYVSQHNSKREKIFLHPKGYKVHPKIYINTYTYIIYRQSIQTFSHYSKGHISFSHFQHPVLNKCLELNHQNYDNPAKYCTFGNR